MHIGVDATCWANARGYGRHARSLIGAMVSADPANHYTLFVDSEEGMESLPSGAEIKFVKNNRPTALAACADGHRSAPDLCRMSLALSRYHHDVLLFPTIYSYVPVYSKAKKVVIVHDVIPEKYPKMTIPKLAPRLLWKAKAALGRFQADAIVTVSDFSRDAIMEQFHLPPDRVFVVSEAADAHFRILENTRLPRTTSGARDPFQLTARHLRGWIRTA